MATPIDSIADKVASYWPGADRKLLTEAYEFAERMHDGQKRLSASSWDF